MYTSIALYGRVIRARWRWVMWSVLVTLLVTTLLMYLWPPLYRSDATVFVRTPGDISRVRDGGDSYAQARARTYSALADNRALSERVVADLGLDIDPDTLASRITAQNRPGTALMDVAVSAPSPEEAQRTATVLLWEYSQTVRAMESVPGSLVPRAELIIIDPPRTAVRLMAWGAPVWLALLGATLLGAFVGTTGAVIRSIFAPSPSDQPNHTDPGANPTSKQNNGTHRARDTREIPIETISSSLPPAGRSDGAAQYSDGVAREASRGETRCRDLSPAAEDLRASEKPSTGTVLIGKHAEGTSELSNANKPDSEP